MSSALLTDILRLILLPDRISCGTDLYARPPRQAKDRSEDQVRKMHEGMRAWHNRRCPPLPPLPAAT